MLRLMVRAATVWDDTMWLRRLTAAVVVTVVCTVAGWVLGSAVLGAGFGLAVLLYSAAEHWVERRRSTGDEVIVDADGDDVDCLGVVRARLEGDEATLIAALDDEIEASQAAVYLGEIGAVSAIPALVPLLEVPDPRRRASAVGALATLSALNAYPKIMKIAERIPCRG
jgi:hypothetical protein